MTTVGERLQPLIDQLFLNMQDKHYLHIDETPVIVLVDPKKSPSKASHQGYMWVYVNEIGAVFVYESSRQGAHPLAMLEEFTGYFQADDYGGYHGVESDKRIRLGCMAHARRNFTDVQKLGGKKSKTPVADHVVNVMAKLYHLEKIAKEKKLTHEEIYQLRQEKAKSVLESLHAYLKEHSLKVPPQGCLGKAIQYCLSNWSLLTRYLEAGHLEIDNNVAERAIRPFAVGRKNWMFCGNSRGAKASANIYSLIESAKLHQLKIFRYLKYVFEELPKADTPKKLEQLLPQYAKLNRPDLISEKPYSTR
jgi:transposase